MIIYEEMKKKKKKLRRNLMHHTQRYLWRHRRRVITCRVPFGLGTWHDHRVKTVPVQYFLGNVFAAGGMTYARMVYYLCCAGQEPRARRICIPDWACVCVCARWSWHRWWMRIYVPRQKESTNSKVLRIWTVVSVQSKSVRTIVPREK